VNKKKIEAKAPPSSSKEKRENLDAFLSPPLLFKSLESKKQSKISLTLPLF